MKIRMMARILVSLFSLVLLFENLIDSDLGVAFASGEECSWISAQRDVISKNFPEVKPNCKESFTSALECCLTPDTCSSGGLLGGFGGQAINDAAKNMAANGAMLGQAAQMAATSCANYRKTCYEACEAERKTINPTESGFLQGHITATKYCNGVFREAESCLMAVVAQASSVVSQASSVATQTAAATALSGASALGGSGTGGSTGDSSGDKVAGYNTPTSGPAPCVTPSGRPCGSSALSAAPTGGSGSGGDKVAGYNTPTSGPAPCVTPSGRPCGSSALSAAPTGGSGSSGDKVAGYNTPTSGPAPCVTPSGRPCGSSALSAAPTGGGGFGSSGGMALTAQTGGGGGGSGSAPSGSAGSGGNSSSSGSGGWGSNPRLGSYGQGLGASPTAAAPGSGGASDPFGSGSGTGSGSGSGSSTGSGGRLPSGVGASTTVASAGTNQGLPDNNCDLEEKVFTPACFDIMNDYCTTTQRQGSGCKSFCRTNSASTACAGSK